MPRKPKHTTAPSEATEGTAAPEEVALLAERCPTVLLADGEAPEVGHRTWNQIARMGEFKGHQQGAFRFDADAFARIVANFRATVNQRVPVDYEHTDQEIMFCGKPLPAVQSHTIACTYPGCAWKVTAPTLDDALRVWRSIGIDLPIDSDSSAWPKPNA